MDSGLRRVPDLGFSECIGDGFVLTRFNKKRVPPLTCLHITHALLCSPRAKGCFFIQGQGSNSDFLEVVDDHLAPLLDQQVVHILDDLRLVRNFLEQILPQGARAIHGQHVTVVGLCNGDGLLEGSDECAAHPVSSHSRCFLYPGSAGRG